DALPHESFLEQRVDELPDVLHIDVGGLRDPFLAHLRRDFHYVGVLREIAEMNQDSFLGRQAHDGHRPRPSIGCTRKNVWSPGPPPLPLVWLFTVYPLSVGLVPPPASAS